ncbi:MAG: hypothetical protein WC332_01060 [Clostridia bacterium]|jgi:flagellar motility protein MotE (MotC chaperone)
MKKNIKKPDNQEKELMDDDSKSSKKISLSSIFKKKDKNDDSDIIEPEKATEEDSEAKPKKKFKIPFKQIILVLGISLLASILLIFIFDWTGWRTSLRDEITTQLLGKEKEVLVKRLEFEYAQKLDTAQNDMLKEERAVLVAEYEELEIAKADFEARMSRLESSEKQLETEKADLEARETELLERINQFENGILEVTELGKIYQAMEPKNAAKILGSMSDAQQIAKILKTMKTDNVAAILELMETQKAADILSKLN